MHPYDSAELDAAAAELERATAALGLPEGYLDSLVFDLAAELAMDDLNATADEDAQDALLDEAEAWAELINNDGRYAQIRYVLGNNWPTLPLDRAADAFRQQLAADAGAAEDP